MRHLYVVIDSSRSMEDQDLKPNRLTSTLKVNPGAVSTHSEPELDLTLFFSLQLMETFVDEYFDQNPISQVGTTVCSCYLSIELSADDSFHSKLRFSPTCWVACQSSALLLPYRVDIWSPAPGKMSEPQSVCLPDNVS